MSISHIMEIWSSDDIITATVEFTLKNDAWKWPYHILQKYSLWM